MRILVVDDDPVQREMAAVALRMGGHQAVTAADGALALAILETETFDVMLLDHEMPGMSGLAVMMALQERALLDRMPVLYVTSRNDIAVIDRAFELGASSFVVKPVNWTLMQHELRFVVRAAENERNSKAARDEAIRLSEMKDQLLNITRHELRSPLHLVIGFGRIVREGLEAGSPLRGAADELVAAAERLNGGVSDMMTCLDLASGRIRPERVAEHPGELIAGGMAPWIRQAAQRGMRLDLQDAGPDARLLVDPKHLLEIVGRVVDNAIRHGGAATRVTIAIRREPENRVRVSVADDGVGIPAEKLTRSYGAFVQGGMALDRGGEGLGLGLHIAQGLAFLNGLDFAIASEGVGRGVVATLSGPAA